MKTFTMNKMSTLLAALLFASVSVAHAETSDPTQPASTGATSVQNNLTANKSNGKADQGLNTAETNITAKHGKADKSKGTAEKAEHTAKPDRPAMPERPDRIERPAGK